MLNALPLQMKEQAKRILFSYDVQLVTQLQKTAANTSGITNTLQSTECRHCYDISRWSFFSNAGKLLPGC